MCTEWSLCVTYKRMAYDPRVDDVSRALNKYVTDLVNDWAQKEIDSAQGAATGEGSRIGCGDGSQNSAISESREHRGNSTDPVEAKTLMGRKRKIPHSKGHYCICVDCRRERGEVPPKKAKVKK
jgi:hypothetical protein